MTCSNVFTICSLLLPFYNVRHIYSTMTAPAMPIRTPTKVGMPTVTVAPGSLPVAPNAPVKAKRAWYVLYLIIVQLTKFPIPCLIVDVVRS